MSRRGKRGFLEKFWSMYLWHRYAGLFAAVFLLHLAATGILLNHTHELALDSKYVKSRWLLSFYDIEPQEEIRGFRVNDEWLTDSGSAIYLGTREIARSGGRLVSGESFAGSIVVILQNELLLLGPDGALIERLPNPLPNAGTITAAAKNAAGHLVVASGDVSLAADSDFLGWSVSAFQPKTRQPEILPAALQEPLAVVFLENTLTWERLVQDLHSGRIAGKGGIWFFDLLGILLALLAVTGIIVWLQRIAAQRERDRN